MSTKRDNRLLRHHGRASARCLRTTRCSPAASTADAIRSASSATAAHARRSDSRTRADRQQDPDLCRGRRPKSSAPLIWTEHGVHILDLQGEKTGRVDLADLMQPARRARHRRHAARRRLGTCVLRAAGAVLVHRVQAYIAPKLIGGAGAKTSGRRSWALTRMVQALHAEGRDLHADRTKIS